MTCILLCQSSREAGEELTTKKKIFFYEFVDINHGVLDVSTVVLVTIMTTAGYEVGSRYTMVIV